MRRILIIGQTPPPFHGQSMMLSKFVNANHSKLKVYHVRMSFSKSTTSIGKFSIRKVFHLIEVVWRVLNLRFKHRINSFYYLPSGPKMIPILRDVVLLFAIRPFFKHSIFHFRAAGLSEYLTNSNFIFRWITLGAYSRPTLAIHLTDKNPRDGQFIRAKNVVTVTNGIEDQKEKNLSIKKKTTSSEILNVLFVGILIKSKGVLELLKAISLVRKKDIRIEAIFLGGWSSNAFKREVEFFCENNHLNEAVSFKGEVLGSEKWEFFKQADVLCFPTYYESESFGNVILEAMMFELPVISTNWRGIPSLIKDKETGFIVEIKDEESMARKLIELQNNRAMGVEMGKNGRERFLKEFTLKQHLDSLEKEIFKAII